MRLLTSEDVGFSPPEKEIIGSLGEMGKISFRLASPGREEDLRRHNMGSVPMILPNMGSVPMILPL